METAVPQRYIQSLFDSMPRRVAEVMAKITVTLTTDFVMSSSTHITRAGHACSHPRVPRAHQAGFSRQSLAGVGLSESVLCHGPGLALLTNGGVQQQIIPKALEYNKNDLGSVFEGFTSFKKDGDRFNICQVIYSQFGLAIHQNDHQARRRFVECAQNEIAVVPDFHKRILFSDEAHFWLNGYVNKQNCRIWSEANPQVYVETPLHPEKLTVWFSLQSDSRQTLIWRGSATRYHQENTIERHRYGGAG
ncbi:hypothetical protein TNCV_2729021 [Trichonephila clavipes]|nr:hypothetical protein TNCV_2729021 [Trichonephila clavipes]